MRTDVEISLRERWTAARRSRFSRLAVILIAVTIPSPLNAQSTKTSELATKRALFDGKTLEGWKKTDFAHAGAVKVDEGRIVLAAGNAMTGITTTRTDLPRINYQLSYSAMRLDGVDFFAAATFPVGDAHLTLVNGGWGGHITGLSSLNGQDASENETSRPIKFENGKWYQFRVRVTDRAIRCWVDGKPIVGLDYRDHQLGTRIETRANEPLGFATYECSGAVKDIAIRTLTAAEVAEANRFE
jgi:Domain of Unknown Function (DUF1080)